MIMRLIALFVAALAVTALPHHGAYAQQVPTARAQYALLIGNARYPDSESPLKEPINDNRAIAEELRRGGFDVEIGENLTREAMQRALAKFLRQTSARFRGTVYFSGYGIQSARQSYMIPVDAQVWAEADVRRDGFSLDAALAEMNSRGSAVKIAILDASRRNPFERRFRSVSAGLAPVAAPTGTLVMYSAAPSAVIVDSAGDRGMFAEELIKQLRTAGLSGEEVFNRTPHCGVARHPRRTGAVAVIVDDRGLRFLSRSGPAVAAMTPVPAPPRPLCRRRRSRNPVAVAPPPPPRRRPAATQSGSPRPLRWPPGRPRWRRPLSLHPPPTAAGDAGSTPPRRRRLPRRL